MNDPALFDDLQAALTAKGPAAAIERLCDDLRQRKDYASLFYALLMKKRQELGVSPVPTGPANELPIEVHAGYEEGIREAGRTVGQLYLDQGNVPQAWAYFRMLGEPGPVAAALERYQPGEEEDIQPMVQIAFYEGVQPRIGFNWILKRYGLCNSITTLSNHDLGHSPDVRQYCIERLVHALHDELRERLRADIERRGDGVVPPEGASIRELIAGRDWLFEDDCYHLDLSHLSSVVQMSVSLPPDKELALARALCEYGRKLSPRYQYASDPPFEDRYTDYGIYLSILAGDNVEEGLAHFHAKADNADPETVGTYPAEVLVNLLLRLDRPTEALAVAKKHLAAVDNRPLSCPSVVELCQKTKDFRSLAEVARAQGDAVHYLAGLLANGEGVK